MKTNLAFLTSLLLSILGSSGLCAMPGSEMSFSLQDQRSHLLRSDGLYLSPVHPRLTLDASNPREAYPRINVSLAGDLCGIGGSATPPREIRRRSNYLSVELAEVAREPRHFSRAEINPVLALPMLLLVLLSSCFRVSKADRG